jgi:chorismate mutase / prephenate dehydratase
MRRILFKLLRGAIIVYISVVLILYFMQDWLLFPGAAYQGKPATVVTAPPGCELIQLSAGGGQITAMFGNALTPDNKLDPEAAQRPTLLYFYGNGAAMAWSLFEFNQFRRLGVNVLMTDYLGYGMSTGKPSEKNLYATADAAYDYLTHQRGIAAGRIVAAGRSLGGAVAIDLASRRPMAALAVFSAFTSLGDMAKQVVRWVPVRWMLKYRFDNLHKIAGIECPIFICNGLKDEIVPPVMSDRLAAAARGPVTRLKIPAADHNGIFSTDPQTLFPALGEFLGKTVVLSPQSYPARLTLSLPLATTAVMAANEESFLDALRSKIDAFDEQIVPLLNARAKIVVEIGKLKQARGTPVYAPDREKVVLERVRKLSTGPLTDRCLEAVYRELMSGSFALERPLKIGFLGPDGSFSHAASIGKFGSSVEHVPLTDIPGVFEAVVRGHVDYGLVPIENSLHGGVIDTLDAFLTSSARICAEVLITIHHNLLAKESWEQIKSIYSKPEVFSQCRHWLATTAKDRDVQPAASTSRAAEMAAQQTGVAAIGSKLAAQLYDLQVLFENIEDNPDNVTRFFVIGREAARRGGDDKTAVMFTTAHTPGALAQVLDVFKENGINLTDVEKRPSKKVNWEYYFFIDAQGHADDPAMQKAIAEARKHCLQLTILGSYPRAVDVL